MSALSRLTSSLAVQVAIDECTRLGRAQFLQRYGFGKSRDFLVQDPKTLAWCDSKAVVGVAYGIQHPHEGALKPADFSGGEATVVSRLKALGFAVMRFGEDWSLDEVQATVIAYFDMLRSESEQRPYVKSSINGELRPKLNRRSQASVELKFQNISAVLHHLNLPFVPGYKPRGNSQLLLRQVVHKYVLDHAQDMRQIIDRLQDLIQPRDRSFVARVVDPPKLQRTSRLAQDQPRARLPRKIDYAARDEANRSLGRAGEQWVIAFEQHRLRDAGLPELFTKLDWISDRLGDGAGYDIQSFSDHDEPRFIEVKTTNGGHESSFVISRNELDFSNEVDDAFYLYRVFGFRSEPALYILRGKVQQHLHLEAIDYRASFRELAG